MIFGTIEHWSAWELFANRWFWAGFGGWLVASFLKMVISAMRTKQFDFTYFVQTGGMPSSHSATVTALATSIGYSYGFGSAISTLAWAFAIVTMFDAATVRRAAGEHAKVLNAIIRDIKELKLKPQQRFKELLGHTRKEVFWGFVTGVAWATVISLIWR